MMDRDFSISMLSHLHGISALLNLSISVVAESIPRPERPSAFVQGVGYTLGDLDVLFSPIWKEHPALEERYLQSPVGRQPEPGWGCIDPYSALMDPHPADVRMVDRETAIRLMQIFDICQMHLEMVLTEAEQAGIPERPHILRAAEAWLSALTRNLVQPVCERFPDLTPGAWQG